MLKMTNISGETPVPDEQKTQLPLLQSLTPETTLALPPGRLEELFYSQAAVLMNIPPGGDVADYIQGWELQTEDFIDSASGFRPERDERQGTKVWVPQLCHVAPMAHELVPAAYTVQIEAAVLKEIGVGYEDVLNIMRMYIANHEHLRRQLDIRDEDIEAYERLHIPAHMGTGKLLSGALAVMVAPEGNFDRTQKGKAQLLILRTRRDQHQRAHDAFEKARGPLRHALAVQIGNLSRVEDRLQQLRY